MDLVDGGLRYDLTVPLVRFYANHANELPSPFKALQIGNVWRADRPQRGRYRQFMQCDIDILGEPSNLAEIELILATTTTLGKLGFQDFVIRINERRILKAMAAYSGFAEEDYDTVFIILDKMDKIGADGVKAELVESGFAAEAADKYMALFDELTANGEQRSMAGRKARGISSSRRFLRTFLRSLTASAPQRRLNLRSPLIRLWCAVCPTIPEPFSKLPSLSLAEAAEAVVVTTRW